MAILAPTYSRSDLRARADRFLDEHHASRTIPVPIERMIEANFHMDIVPVPGLHGSFGIDAFITSDLTEIRVDQYVYESRENRYRFSLAHELAHRELHADVFRQLQFSTIAQWKSARAQISEREYGFIEWHANYFAGLVLVPPIRLAEQFEVAKRKLAALDIHLDNAEPAAWDALETSIAREFVVSPNVIRRRGPDDDLWDA